MSDLVGNPEDPFSHNEAHVKLKLDDDCLVVQLVVFSSSGSQCLKP